MATILWQRYWRIDVSYYLATFPLLLHTRAWTYCMITAIPCKDCTTSTLNLKLILILIITLTLSFYFAHIHFLAICTFLFIVNETFFLTLDEIRPMYCWCYIRHVVNAFAFAVSHLRRDMWAVALTQHIIGVYYVREGGVCPGPEYTRRDSLVGVYCGVLHRVNDVNGVYLL